MKEFMKYDFEITKIAVACYVGAGKGALVHPCRPNHGLVLVTGGEKYYVFDDGTRIHSEKKRILYLPQGQSYYIENIEDGDCYAINFSLTEPVSFRPFSINTNAHIHLLECFKAAVFAWQTKPFGVDMYVKSQLCDIIGVIQKEYGGTYMTKGTAELISPAIDYIHREYTNANIPVAELAVRCGISESYFRRIFQNTFGCSPLQYIKDLKIARAKELLKSQMYTVSAVAALSGYHDECYFSREFKKNVGISPSEYN